MHYIASLLIKSQFNLGKFLLLGALCGFLARFSWGVALLLRFPALFTAGQFSHTGPSEAQLRSSGFNMVFDAFGTPDGGGKPELVVRMLLINWMWSVFISLSQLALSTIGLGAWMKLTPG